MKDRCAALSYNNYCYNMILQQNNIVQNSTNEKINESKLNSPTKHKPDLKQGKQLYRVAENN